MDSTYSPEEQRLIDAWEGHLRCEFTDRDAAATVATMSDDNYVNHVPVMTGGRGRDEMLAFYGSHFIPKMPADTRLTPVCRTVGQERVIDEMIFAFTHDIVMDWMVPGVAPTGRWVEVPLIVVVQLRAGQVVCERIYWDQASVLVQLGLLEPSHLPVVGADTARKVLNPGLLSRGQPLEPRPYRTLDIFSGRRIVHDPGHGRSTSRPRARGGGRCGAAARARWSSNRRAERQVPPG